MRMARVLCWFGVVLLAGCGGDGSGRVPLSGTVAVDGQPLERGEIAFVPQSGTAGPTIGTAIERGGFSVSRAEGPTPGTYRVEIRATRPTGRKIPDEFRPPPDNLVDEIEQFIPRRYNVDSELTVQVDSKPEPLTFDLRTAP